MKAFIFAVAMTLGFGAQAKNVCKAHANEAMEQAGLSGGTLVYVDKIAGKKGQPLFYHYWFRVPQCQKGYVVVNLNFGCNVTDVYERDGCDVETLGDQDAER